MPSDAQLAKRDRYLAEGKIKVVEADHGWAVVLAYGSGSEPYIVRFRANEWSCSCPAQKLDCVHVLAAMLVSPLRSQAEPSDMVRDAEIDSLLSDESPGGYTSDPVTDDIDRYLD